MMISAGLHAYKLGVGRVTVDGREAEFAIRDPLPAEQQADAVSGAPGCASI